MARITKIQPRPNTFRVDNIIIDDYGEKIGAIGVAIYNVLARHADRETGICYPSIRLMARKLALGRTTVKKYLRILLNHWLIAISSRLSDEGDPTSNLYSRWHEIRACNDNACRESKSQNSHDSLLDLTFLIAATDPKAPIY